ncbi:MAG: hypothetical protein LBR26_15600 [Prevotella sp.]|jgi:hypothetical protein|nr:hypothetical protein [Prevotella sp.]
MEPEKIKLYGSRDFGANFDLSIKFIKRHLVPVSKGLAYLIPSLLIVAFFMPNSFKMYYDIGFRASSSVTFMDDMFGPGLFIAYMLLILVMLAMALYTICYMALYAKQENGEATSSSAVWKKVSKAALPVLGASILFGIMVAVGSLLCLVPGVLAAVYFGFYMYVYVNEDLGVIGSFRRSYALVRRNFWVTLGYSLVFSLLISMAGCVFVVPYYAGLIASMLQVEFFSNGIVFFILIFISFVGYNFLYPAFYMAMGVMYYSHRNKLDGLDMETEIDNIGKYDNNRNAPY